MEACTSSSDATAPSDISTHPSSDKAVPIAGEVQEAQNDAMQVLLAAVKRRRRSSVFVPPVAEASEGSTLDAASAITTKRRKSINAVRRSSITRRSLCSAPPPVLSISDQMRAVMTSNKTTLPQLLDICIRESVSQLCQDQSSNSLLPALKSVLVLNSEQVSEEVGEQLASEGITTASLLLRRTPLSASQQNNTENAVVNVKESRNLNENLKMDVGKGKRESNTESDKENVAGSRKRKDVFNENSSKGDEVVPSTEDHDVIHKRRLISEYERKTELLRAEHKAWKLLKVQRKEHHAAAKREYGESRSGKQRIGEEQASLLNVEQKAFLEGAPDYGRCLQQLGRVAEESLYAVARCEQTVSRLCAEREELNAAADRAYDLVDAAVYSADQSSLRSLLHELSS